MRVRDEKGSFYEYTYDANNHMTRMIHQAGASHITTLYTYDKDGREQTTKVMGGYTKTTAYDKYGRASGITLGTKKNFEVKFTYPSASGNQERALPSSVTAGQRTLSYKYDQNGNITSVQENPGSGGTVKTDTFQYDERNQLIRENSQTQNKTFVYEYDEGGNLTAVKEYAYTTTASLPAAEKTETGSYSSTWKDQLLSWNGTAMTYDTIGNMLTRGNTSYTWTQGRKLSGVNNGKSIQYSYDHTGARVKKAVDGVTTEYRMAGDLLVSETTGGQTFWYHYDSGANLVSMVVGGKNYFYVRNLQNDVIALVDEDGNTVVNYTYDSWGKILSVTGSLKDTIGQQNPFRYRGYYYDRETGMYYLKSRYYDPELRRFISSDSVTTVVASMETFHNRNLYVYCNENPVVRGDKEGRLWQVITAEVIAAGVIGAAVSLGYQMLVEDKPLNLKTVGQAALDGISMAVGASAAGVAVQIAVNVGTSIVSGFLNGDDMSEIAVQAGTSAVLAGIGGDGADFAGKRFREKMLATYGKYDQIGRLDVAAAIYRSEKNNFKRKNVVNVEKTVIATGVSYGKDTYTYYSSPWVLFAHSVRYLSDRTEYVKMYYKNGQYKNVVYQTVWK